LFVNGDYFDSLGVKAAYGRIIQPEHDQPGANPSVVISHKLWQKQFGADPSIVGKTVFLNNNSFTVVGITPETFTGTDLGRTPEIFVPFQMYTLIGFQQALTTDRGMRQFSILGRLKPGVDAGSAQASLAMLSRQLSGAYPDDWIDRNKEPRKISVISESYMRVRPEVRSILTRLAGLFMVVVALVLLIACSNISNILLARATARQREMAVRTALGASRKRLIRQLLTESLQLSLFGSILGILIAPICVRLIVATFLPPSANAIPVDVGINQRVILLTLGLGLITGLIFGLVPALHASRIDLSLAMKDDATAVQTGFRKLSFRNILVTTQLAVSLLLLIVAGLFITSLQKAQQVDLGYNINNVLTARPDTELLDSRDAAGQLAFYGQVLERVRSIPGVESASFADMVPSGSGRRRSTVSVEHYTPKAGENMDLLWGVVAPDYFRTMGMTLVSGREFTELDKEGALRVAVINETMARQYWPGENPLGKKITLAGGRNSPLAVVGVVKDAVPYIYQTTPSPFFYVAMLQNPSPGMVLHVRTKGDAIAMLPAIRNEVESLGQKVVLRNVKTLVDYMDESLLMLRFASILTGLFGGLALVLALVGVFSVINYSTSRRTREIGIRLAVGAQRVDILKMIMKEGLFIVGVGVLIGQLMAFAGVRLIASLMFGNSGTDLSVYVALSLLLIAVALVACFMPAYKATKVDPSDALRYE
jgi:macrolide transport system ATP-binding/permease protein